MNPLGWTIIQTMLHLKWTCPRCGKDQVVTTKERHTTARCKSCGADMPPPDKKK